MQHADSHGPSTVNVLGLVQSSMRTEGIELVPSQLVACGQAQRRIGRISSLSEALGTGASPFGVDPGPGREGGGLCGHHPTGGSEGECLNHVVFRSVRMLGNPGVLGQIDESDSEIN